MAELLPRLQNAVAHLDDVRAKGIVGGSGFMWRGNLLCGVLSGDLVVRVGKSGFAAAMEQPGTAPMTMAGRASDAWVVVDAEHVADDDALQVWVERGVTFVATLPSK